jgi:phosphate uptake regulator
MNISAAQHTVTAFDAEILDLREMVLEMGKKSTGAITRAIEALERNDLELAVRSSPTTARLTSWSGGSMPCRSRRLPCARRWRTICAT